MLASKMFGFSIISNAKTCSLNNNLKKLGVRFSITEKRKKLFLMKSRCEYRKNKANYSILRVQSKIR